MNMAKRTFRVPLDPYYRPDPAVKLHPVGSCNGCGGGDFARWKRIGPWTISRCVRCGLCFLDPRPDASELYADYHERLHIEDAASPEAIQRGIAAWDERAEMISRFKKPGRALDLGCASGFFLANLRKRGWEVAGCEVAAWAAQRARELFGLDVITSDILTADLPAGAFDLVTLWDVIEHVPDPAATLAKARQAAKPEGLVVVRVPNVASLNARTLGKDWISWCLPYHFYHFTPRTLTALVERNGLSPVHMEIGASTMLWEFLLMPLAMPPHHVKLVSALPRLSSRLASVWDALRRRLLTSAFCSRHMPGPTITLLTQPRAGH